MKKKEISQKTRDVCWLLFLTKVSEITLEELRAVTFLAGLLNGTCCVRLEDIGKLKAAGINSSIIQKKVLRSLYDKNIVIPSSGMNYDTANYIAGHICVRCPLEKISKQRQCHLRKGDIFINKDHTQWILSKRPLFNEKMIYELLENNGVCFDSPYKISMTQKIQEKMEYYRTKHEDNLMHDDAMEMFMEAQEMKNLSE